MTKNERMMRFYNRLAKAGFSMAEANQLRKIEMTLHRWAAEECNGTIQRDEATDKPYRHYPDSPYRVNPTPVPDRENGALCRLEALLADGHSAWAYYHQTDPRGHALYLVPAEWTRDEAEQRYHTAGVSCAGWAER